MNPMQYENIGTNAGPRASAEGEGTKQTPRYKESEVITKFLDSNSGISFLIDPQARGHCVEDDSDMQKEGKNIYDRVDDIIDFYTAWTNNFPVRKNLKVSKYEFLKSVENFCAKPEINQKYAERLSDQ